MQVLVPTAGAAWQEPPTSDWARVPMSPGVEASVPVIDEFAKDYLHDELRSIRSVLVRKVDGLSEYDIRRPLTATGTNLLGLVKHLALWESRYFGEVFDRPFPGSLARWDDFEANRASLWVTAEEPRDEILDLYREVARHSDATIDALAVDAPGHVPWWPRPEVMLFNVLVHMLTETTRHAGHADILREQLDGAVGDDSSAPTKDDAHWRSHWARIEDAARAVGTRT
ncbi:MAG: DinB family protein [Marmoricola sp.]|nr:DinB family protein [Marmoricola sp.]